MVSSRVKVHGWSTMVNIAVCTSPLPVELILLIVRIAATRNRATAAALCLVSRWVRNEVEPILYRVLTCTPEIPRAQRVKRLNNPLYITNASCFGFNPDFFDGIRGSLKASALVQSNTRILNFMTNSGLLGEWCDSLPIFFPCVQEVHIFGIFAPDDPAFLIPHLRRLHLALWRDSYMNFIRAHASLTHIALEFPAEGHDSIAVQNVVTNLLAEHKPLLVLLVRLRVSDGNSMSSVGLAHALLSTIHDRRLVVVPIFSACEDRSGGYNEWARNAMYREAFFNEWEQNALTGRTIWDVAEAAVKATSPQLGKLISDSFKPQ